MNLAKIGKSFACGSEHRKRHRLPHIEKVFKAPSFLKADGVTDLTPRWFKHSPSFPVFRIIDEVSENDVCQLYSRLTAISEDFLHSIVTWGRCGP